MTLKKKRKPPKRRFDSRPRSGKSYQPTPPPSYDSRLPHKKKVRKMHFTKDGVRTYCHDASGYPVTRYSQDVECKLCRNKMKEEGIL